MTNLAWWHGIQGDAGDVVVETVPDGTATLLSANNWGQSFEFRATCLTSHGGSLYVWNNESSNQGLYVVDPEDGSTTLVGRSNSELYGMTSHKGVLYGISLSQLFSVNPSTGATTVIANIPRDSVTGGTIIRGLASDGNVLYAVASKQNVANSVALFSVDTTTAAATQIGSADRFGVGETGAGGLAFHKDVLYMVGNGIDTLYSVSLTTGVATRVGSATQFGVGVTDPNGLASHNGVLYMAGDKFSPTEFRALYTMNERSIDTPTVPNGLATRIGTVENFGVGEIGPLGLASHDGVLYMSGWNNRTLYSVDETTGMATAIGSAFPSSRSCRGLASHNGVLYFLENRDDALYTIDPSNARLTRVGNAESGFGVDEFNAGDITSHNGILYMTGFDTDRLYTLNTTTGVATRVANRRQFNVGESAPFGLASHKGVLYMTGDTTDILYTLNPSSAIATRVGSATDFGIGVNSTSALTSHNGVLYMTASTPYSNLYRLNESFAT